MLSCLLKTIQFWFLFIINVIGKVKNINKVNSDDIGPEMAIVKQTKRCYSVIVHKRKNTETSSCHLIKW